MASRDGGRRCQWAVGTLLAAFKKTRDDALGSQGGEKS